MLCGRGFRELLRPGRDHGPLGDVSMLSALMAMYARVLSCLLPAFASSRTRQWHAFDATQHAPRAQANVGDDKDQESVVARVSVLFYVAAFMVFMSSRCCRSSCSSGMCS